MVLHQPLLILLKNFIKRNCARRLLYSRTLTAILAIYLVHQSTLTLQLWQLNHPLIGMLGPQLCRSWLLLLPPFLSLLLLLLLILLLRLLPNHILRRNDFCIVPVFDSLQVLLFQFVGCAR